MFCALHRELLIHKFLFEISENSLLVAEKL